MIISNRYSFIVLLSASLLLTACNDEIFVDRIPEYEDKQITLDGNGGSYTLCFDPKSARSIKFDNSSDYFTYTDYYNANGEQIVLDAPIADIAKIVYGSPRFTVEAHIEGDKISIVSLDNTYSEDLQMWLTIDYEYMARTIDVTLTPGSPMHIDYLGCDMDRALTAFRTSSPAPIHISNESDRSISMDIFPFKDYQSRFCVKNDYLWTIGISGLCPIPYYINGEWFSDDTNLVEITMGQESYYYSEYTDKESFYHVEVPPHSTVNVYVSLKLAVLKGRYISTVTQPNSALSWMIDGEFEVIQPISYSVEVK